MAQWGLLLWTLVSVPILVVDWWKHFFGVVCLVLLFVYFDVKRKGLSFLDSSPCTLGLHCSLSLWDRLLRSHEQGGLDFLPCKRFPFSPLSSKKSTFHTYLALVWHEELHASSLISASGKKEKEVGIRTFRVNVFLDLVFCSHCVELESEFCAR